MKSLLLVILLLLAHTGFTQTTELRLASDVWPPFTDVAENNSFALDLVNEALRRIEIKTTQDIHIWNEVMKGIDDGTYDGSGAMWLDDDREEKFLFSKAYLENQLILVGKKGSDVSAEAFNDLYGKHIGIVEDYSYGEELFSVKEIVLVPGKSDQQNLERLLSDKIDFMLVDALLIQYLLKYQVNDISEYLSIATTPILVKSLHMGLKKDIPDCGEIIERFNAKVDEMIADGTYNKILHLNWIKADMDGDGKMELILSGDKAGTSEPSGAYGIYADKSGSMAGSNRYYIEGKTYSGWESVPDRYKSEILGTDVANPNQAGFKLDFK